MPTWNQYKLCLLETSINSQYLTLLHLFRCRSKICKMQEFSNDDRRVVHRHLLAIYRCDIYATIYCWFNDHFLLIQWPFTCVNWPFISDFISDLLVIQWPFTSDSTTISCSFNNHLLVIPRPFTSDFTTIY